jgi:hypothetical protein
VNRRPHALNVVGPFYVEDGCCTACGVPWAAPGMFGRDIRDHCYVRRQPETHAELDVMIRVLASQELNCIRYKGDDEGVIQRLVNTGMEAQSDTPPPDHLRRMMRTCVTFVAIEKSQPWTRRDIEARLAAALASPNFVSREADGALEVAWYQGDFHRIEIGRDLAPGRWVLQHFAPPLFSYSLHDWLEADEMFVDIRWQTETEWASGGAWLRTPY